MNGLPATLIQIHYHLRTGGVRRVMSDLSESFLRLVPNGKSIVCTASSVEAFRMDDAEYRPFDMLDYCDNIDAENVFAFSEKIFCFISKIIEEEDLPKPILLLGHNINLAKNIALSKAFAELNSHYVNCEEIKFMMMVHDLAEENRPDRMSLVEAAERNGLPVRQWLWPECHYLTVNRRNERLFDKAGFSATWLPNRIVAINRSRLIDKQNLHLALQTVAATDEIVIKKNQAIIFYPVRVIERKNIAEAIFLVSILFDGVLLIGSSGTKQSDKEFFGRMKELVSKFNLPVIFNADRISAACGVDFSTLYEICDFAISTSTAEGFGYGIYEPCLYGKSLVGRMPHGVEEDTLIDLSHLYTRLPLPKEFPFCGACEDFAALPVSARERILELALDNSAVAELLRETWLAQIKIPAGETIVKSKENIGHELSGKNWDEKFLSVLVHENDTLQKGNPFLMEKLINDFY